MATISDTVSTHLQVPYYDYALDLILDNEPPQDVMLTDQQHELLESAAEMLFGLIHARWARFTFGSLIGFSQGYVGHVLVVHLVYICQSVGARLLHSGM